jgi:hypothetical protein
MRRIVLAFAAALGLAAGAGPAPAAAQQSVAVVPVQGLQFGPLMPGIPTDVSPVDRERRASLELVGGGHVTVTLQLPDALVSTASARLPLLFPPGSARIVFAKSGRTIDFDPLAPVSFNLPPGQGGATLYLGGSARPAATQPPGTYTGSITARVVIANAGV